MGSFFYVDERSSAREENRSRKKKKTSSVTWGEQEGTVGTYGCVNVLLDIIISFFRQLNSHQILENVCLLSTRWPIQR
jgi:hypothetical protein